MEPITDTGATQLVAEGDIVEVTVSGTRRTAEVMLLSDGLVLLDFFDGDRPVLAPVAALDDLQVFRPDNDLIAA